MLLFTEKETRGKLSWERGLAAWACGIVHMGGWCGMSFVFRFASIWLWDTWEVSSPSRALPCLTRKT